MKEKKALTQLQTILFIMVICVAFVVGLLIDRYILISPAAQAESIVFTCWGGDFGDLTNNIAENFTRDYGNSVLLEYHAGASSTVISKIEATWPEVKIDLTSVAPSVAYQLAEAGYLAELTKEECPVLDQIPDNLLIKYDGKIYGVGIYVIPVISCAWRSDLISEPIANWTDLFKEGYSGKIATSYLPLGTGDSLMMSSYWFNGSEYDVEPGWEHLTELAPHIGGIWTTESECINFMASGERPICLCVTADKLYQWYTQGVQVDWIPYFNDTEKAFAVAVDCVVALDGPRQQIAKHFINYYFSPKHNEYLTGNIGLLPSNKYAQINLDIAPFSPTSEQIEKYGKMFDIPWKAAHIDEWVTKWDEDIAPLIGTG